MLDWERRALKLGPSDEPHVLSTLDLSFDPGAERTRTAWWVTAFFAPEIWRRWGVGLLHGSLNLWSAAGEDWVHLPGIAADLPEDVSRQISKEMARRWAQVKICPVLVSGEALGFVIRGPETPPAFVEVFAPTQLMTRLGIPPNQRTPVSLDVLACGY